MIGKQLQAESGFVKFKSSSMTEIAGNMCVLMEPVSGGPASVRLDCTVSCLVFRRLGINLKYSKTCKLQCRANKQITAG